MGGRPAVRTRRRDGHRMTTPDQRRAALEKIRSTLRNMHREKP